MTRPGATRFSPWKWPGPWFAGESPFRQTSRSRYRPPFVGWSSIALATFRADQGAHCSVRRHCLTRQWDWSGRPAAIRSRRRRWTKPGRRGSSMLRGSASDSPTPCLPRCCTRRPPPGSCADSTADSPAWWPTLRNELGIAPWAPTARTLASLRWSTRPPGKPGRGVPPTLRPACPSRPAGSPRSGRPVRSVGGRWRLPIITSVPGTWGKPGTCWKSWWTRSRLGRTGRRRCFVSVSSTITRTAGRWRSACSTRRCSRGVGTPIWGAMLKWSDDFGAARVKLGGRCRRAAEIGDDSSLPFVLYQLSELECWAGDWDRARQYAEEACRVALESEQVAVLPAALYARALVDTHLGRIESARADAEEALALAARTRNVPVALEARSVLGLIELSQGNFERTHAHLGPVAEAMAAMEVAEPGVVRFWANEIEALIGLGELDKATAGVAQLEERGRSLDRPWALATGARCRGLLEAARGDLGAADRALERALKEHERLPMPFEFGRTLLVQGTIRRRARQKRAARDSLERAVEIFERLGAPLWADKARAELRRIGLRPPAPSGLTPSEERVAELVAAGHTNREVADALFISVKTVDSNLSRIYRKLGVRSRTELARKLPAEGGPAPTS